MKEKKKDSGNHYSPLLKNKAAAGNHIVGRRTCLAGVVSGMNVASDQ